MCMFPTPNYDINGEAYRRGIHEFECGSCPECLARRSSRWALRGAMELKTCKVASMVCLTYDNYIRDARGHIVGEQVADRTVDKRDVQLFIKRLRKWYWKEYGRTLKYLVSAEYGKHTHRPHYHAILFGVEFPDIVPYKKSKRGNLIYKSAILTSLWGHGICTVDSIAVNAAAIRYCTKYSMKDKEADTFMLCSRNIGLEAMLAEFNGKSYIVEGREYPVPRQVWERFICDWYVGVLPEFTPKYRGFREYGFKVWRENCKQRRAYRALRDQDTAYQGYLKYWSEKAAQFEATRRPVLERILALDNNKYFSYKQKALEVYRVRIERGVPLTAPRKAIDSRYARWLWESFKFDIFALPPSCQGRANDTKTTVSYLMAAERRSENRKNASSVRDWFIGITKIFPQISIFEGNFEKILV